MFIFPILTPFLRAGGIRRNRNLQLIAIFYIKNLLTGKSMPHNKIDVFRY